LVVSFCWLFWGLALHKTQGKIQEVVAEALRIMVMANEHKTKDVQSQRPSNVNFSLFVCFFDVYWASESFLLLTKVGIILSLNSFTCASHS